MSTERQLEQALAILRAVLYLDAGGNMRVQQMSLDYEHPELGRAARDLFGAEL